MSNISIEAKDANFKSILEQLNPFFYPRTIAIIGASQDTWKSGSAMLGAIKEFGYKGAIYPISNRPGEIFGLKVYTALKDVPEAVDLAFIFTPAKAVPTAVRDCREKKVPAVVVFPSGFSETGNPEGIALEQELSSLKDGSFRMVGPNCFGVYSPAGGLTQLPGVEFPKEAGEISFFSQSGSLSEDFARASLDWGFRYRKVVSYGNACDLNEADWLEYFEADDESKIVGMYIEGARNGHKFAEVLRRIGPKKPTIVWKGGLTPTGARAAASHTASLAGSLTVWNALLKQTGAIQVKSQDEALDTFAAFHFLPNYSDNRVGYICCGGGNGVAASDACYEAGLVMPKLSPELRERIEKFQLPNGTSNGNPIDMGVPFPPADDLKNVVELLALSGEVGAIVIDKLPMSPELRRLLHYREQMGWPDDPSLTEIPLIVTRETGIPIIPILREGGDVPGSAEIETERLRLRRYFQDNGHAVYPTAERALKAVGKVVAFNSRKTTARKN